MEKRAFGSAGPQVPIIGQGTWNMEGDDRASAVRALQRGLDLGLTHVDTAELYGHGRVEELVGEALRGRRDEVFLVSKVMPSNATFEGTLRACERSLKALRTDHLDCYLLHWPGEHPLERTIAAFEKLVQEGKIRSWGVSNFDVDALAEVVRFAGPHKVACNQVLYHLEERAIEERLLPWCTQQGIALVGYSPFGSGSFPSARSAGGRVLAEIAQKHGATPRQVALAFLVREPNTFTIPKAADPGHVEDNAGAARVRLDADDLRRIDEAFPMEPKDELPTL